MWLGANGAGLTPAGLRGRCAAGDLSILSQPQVAVLDRLFLWLKALALCWVGVCLTSLRLKCPPTCLCAFQLICHTQTLHTPAACGAVLCVCVSGVSPVYGAGEEQGTPHGNKTQQVFDSQVPLYVPRPLIGSLAANGGGAKSVYVRRSAGV